MPPRPRREVQVPIPALHDFFQDTDSLLHELEPAISSLSIPLSMPLLQHPFPERLEKALEEQVCQHISRHNWVLTEYLDDGEDPLEVLENSIKG